MARILAVRRPDLVAGIACLGSPLTEQFAVHPMVRGQIRAVATLGSVGLRGLFSHRCRDGECCAQTTAEATAPVREGLPFLSVYSRSDGIVDWHACLDAQATHVEVRSSHCGMAVNPAVFRALAQWLPAAAAPGGTGAADTRLAAAA